MERTRLIVNFDSSGDKLLSTENVIACGETFDILFRDVTLSGTVRVAFWDYETLLWRSEGSASQGDGGSILEGLVADTKELADVFRGGSGFFAARLTVGEQVGGDEWRDYGFAYVRLYRGTNPSENPPPAESVAAELREAITAEQTAREEADEKLRAAIDGHAGRTDNPHHVTAAQVGALTETAANTLYPRFRDETGTTTVGNNHGRNVMASQNGENGGFYVTGVAGNPPSRKQWLTEYQRNRVRVYTATSGESKDYYWDDTPSGDAEKMILRWCDLFAQAVTTVWRGIMRMCNPRIAANADDASKDIALVPNANGAGLQVQFPGGATAMIRAKTGTLATVAEVNEKDASTLAEAKAYADGKVVDVYRFKGSVTTKDDLPKSGNVTGDVWNVSEDGMNYAWTGTEWDALGTSVDLSAYYTKTESDGRYLKLTGGTVTGETFFSGGIRTDSLTSRFGTPFHDTTPSRGFNFLSIYQLTGYIAGVQRGKVFFTQENATTNWIDVTTLKEGGTPISDKYAPKTHAHSDYLSLSLTDWQHIKGPISFDYAHPYVASVNITSINGVANNTQVVEHGLLYINCNVTQDTDTYLRGMRRVMIAGHPALRKIDCDTLYAAKADVYTKAQVDEKITSALGDIQAALAAI